MVWYNPVMKPQLLLIKIGGSIITDKSKATPTPILPTISDLTQQISELYKSGKYQIILVHGAGSYGHPIVKKHQLHLGVTTDEQKVALAQTHQFMLQLNSLIVEALIKQDIPAISLPPHAFVEQEKGQVKKFDHTQVKNYLHQKYLPVLFGDGVVDKVQGASILSGDTIVCALGKKLKADKIIFLSDVNGVYTDNPKLNPKAQHIPLITSENFNEVVSTLEGQNEFDVTGEMQGKLQQVVRHLKGVDVWLADGRTPKVLADLIQGVPIGTRLAFH